MSLHSSESVFILDFDGTITAKDTISSIFGCAVEYHAGNGRGREMSEALEDILSQYGKDLEEHKNFVERLDRLRNVEEVVEYQRRLKVVEMASFERVSKSGIFGGIDGNLWREFGEKAVFKKVENGVVVRRGFEQFVKGVQAVQGKWGVVSVNFIEDWIRGVLGPTGIDVEIIANEPDERGFLRGSNSGKLMATSDAKLAAMKTILKGFRMGETPRAVYIGDSGTDIECLLEEGITGIVMVEEDGSSKLLDTLRSISSNSEYRFLRNIKGIKDYDGKRGKALYFAKDFREIVGSPLFQ